MAGEVAPAVRGPGLRPKTILVGLSVGFLVALAVQRSRSGFLRAEAGMADARAVAGETGLAVSEVLALHEQLGGGLAAAQLGARARELAARRDELGHVLLAVLAVRGELELARRLRAEAGPDPVAIERAVRGCREAVEIAVRFANVVERFESRSSR